MFYWPEISENDPLWFQLRSYKLTTNFSEAQVLPQEQTERGLGN